MLVFNMPSNDPADSSPSGSVQHWFTALQSTHWSHAVPKGQSSPIAITPRKTSRGKLKHLVVNFGLHLLCVLKRELANALVGGKESLSVSTDGDFSTSLYTIYKETSESSTEGPQRTWTWAITKPFISHYLICKRVVSQHPLVHHQGFSRQIPNSVNHLLFGTMIRKTLLWYINEPWSLQRVSLPEHTSSVIPKS